MNSGPFSFTPEDTKDVQEGDIFAFFGKRYKLTKKTTTAIAVERWYWFDDVGAWVGRKLGR